MKRKFSLEEILNVIKAYIETHGYPPTQRELAAKILLFCVDNKHIPAGNAGG